MVTWSLETLLLALELIGILCALYITVRAFQQEPKWGALILGATLVGVALVPFIGLLAAGLLALAAQFIYMRQPYPWKEFGRIWIYVILCWAGATYIDGRRNGFLPMLAPRTPPASVAVAQEGVAGTNETFLDVDGGRIWYKKTGTGAGTPVVLLHGGPGAASFYLKPLEALGDDRPVVRYDQLGAGHSDQSADSTRFTVARYVAELDSLRAALGIERMHILGHTWGAILGFEYYRAHPNRVASLTFASPVFSGPTWVKNTRALLQNLSPETQKVIAEREATGDYDAPDYKAAVDEFSRKYVMLRPDETELDSMTKAQGQAAYAYLWGPSAFTLTGSLRTYDATAQLRRVRVPTLYTVGEFDEADPETVKRFAKLTPRSRVEVIPDAANITTWDNPTEMLRIVREFLRGVDSTAAAAAAPPQTP